VCVCVWLLWKGGLVKWQRSGLLAAGLCALCIRQLDAGQATVFAGSQGAVCLQQALSYGGMQLLVPAVLPVSGGLLLCAGRYPAYVAAGSFCCLMSGMPTHR
jgi:hypothetical protein